MLQRRDYAHITLSYISFIIIGIPGGMRGVAWPSIREQFGLPLDGLALLILGGTISYTLSSFFSGRVISSLGMRWSLALGAIISAVGTLGYAVAPSWWVVVAAGFVAGMGAGIVDSGLNLHFARVYSPRLMNWLHAAFGLGAAFGPLLMTWFIINSPSWQLAYLLVAALQLIVGFSFAVMLKSVEPVNLDDGTPHPKRITASIADTLRQPFVWLSVGMFFIYAGIEVTPSDWMPSLLTTVRNIDEQTAGTWVGIYWLSFTVGRIVFGIIANRVPVNGSIRACMVAMIVGAGLIWWNPSNTMSLVGLAILGFGLGPIFPLLISTTPERMGDAYATHAVGFQVAAASFGIGVLPSLAGSLGATYGLEIILPFIAITSVLMFGLFQVLTLRRFTLTLAEQP